MDALTGARFAADAVRAGLEVEQAYEKIVRATTGALTSGTFETPARAAKAWAELTSGYSVDIPGLFKTFDGEGFDEMIAVSDVPFTSLCEHHLLPFSGMAHVVYVPTEKVIGLSKIPRLIDAYARRLQIQERLACQIADALVEHLNPHGVLVMLEAHHSCMSLRGVRSHGRMVTSVTRGHMRDDQAGRAEALALVGKHG